MFPKRKHPSMQSRVSELTIKELELFILASRTNSFREVARQWNILPAQVSKIIKKIEQKVGTQLFKRSVSGVVMTPEAVDILDAAEQICEISEGLKIEEHGDIYGKDPICTIGSISFLTTYLLAPAISEMRSSAKKKSRFRLIEFTHNDLVAHGLKGAFEMALHIEKLEWTNTWESVLLGKIPWKLYGRVGHPLGLACTEADVLKFPFVVPVDWSSYGYVVGEDHCPVSARRRIRGDEAATAETALELCRHSSQLTFIPEVLAKGWGHTNNMLTEIKVKSWPQVSNEIYLSVKSDIIKKNLMDSVVKNIKLLL